MLIGIGGGKRGGKAGKAGRACCGGAPGPCSCDDTGAKGLLGPKGPKGLRHLGGLGKKVRGAQKVGRVKGLKVGVLGSLEGLGDNDLLDAGERATFLGLDGLNDEDYGGGGMGDTIDTSASYLTAGQIMRAADTFDVSLNAWFFDFSKAAAKLPKALVEQVDGFVKRWRDVKDSFYIFETTRIKDIVNAMAEWNGIRDTVAGYGVKSVVGPATVSVNGQQVAADKIPYTPDFFTQVASYAKWAGLAVGGLLLVKVAGDLGVTKQISGLVWDWSDKKHKRSRAEAVPATVG